MEKVRRSARTAAASKPAPAPPPEKPEARGKARGAKRPATPTDPSPSPPPDQKRSKTEESLKETNGDAKPNGLGPKPSGKLTKKSSKSAADFVQTKPYFNPLPAIPEPRRPGLLVFVWGAGNFGQFGMGDGQLGELRKPTRNRWVERGMGEGRFGSNDGAGFESIAAGGLYSLFVDENGTVWSCGTNDDAALGRITSEVPDPEKPGEFMDVDTLTTTPHPIQSLVDEKFRAVRIAAGDSVSAAISTTGELRAWGHFRANEGALGFSTGRKHQVLPIPIMELPVKPGDMERFVAVAAGNNHLIVMTTHGNVYTWGAGEQGQLGRKVIERRKIHGTAPERVVLGMRSRKAIIIGAGNYTSFAVDDQGDVWGWGMNSMGQTGTGIPHAKLDHTEVLLPKKVIGLSQHELNGESVVEIAGGDHHTLFLTSGGRVFAVGRSDEGQLGLPEDHPIFTDREYPDYITTPTQVTFPEHDDPVRHVAVGVHCNMAVTEGGALYAWGRGGQSELGLGVGVDSASVPTIVVRRVGGPFAACDVACGGQHTLALLREKTT